MKYKDVRITDRVYSVASSHIFRTGLKGWHMDQLAEECGLTKRTLYKIVPNKEALVEQVMLKFINSVQENLSAVLKESKNFKQSISDMADLFPQLVSGTNSGIIQEIFLEYPAIEEKLIKQRSKITAGLIAFLQKGVKQGQLRKDLEPAFIIEMLQAFVLYFIKSDPTGAQSPAKIKAAVHCLLHGILRD